MWPKSVSPVKPTVAPGRVHTGDQTFARCSEPSYSFTSMSRRNVRYLPENSLCGCVWSVADQPQRCPALMPSDVMCVADVWTSSEYSDDSAAAWLPAKMSVTEMDIGVYECSVPSAPPDA